MSAYGDVRERERERERERGRLGDNSFTIYIDEQIKQNILL